MGQATSVYVAVARGTGHRLLSSFKIPTTPQGSNPNAHFLDKSSSGRNTPEPVRLAALASGAVDSRFPALHALPTQCKLFMGLPMQCDAPAILAPLPSEAQRAL